MDVDNFTLHTIDANNTYIPSRLGTLIGATVAFAFIIFGILGNLLIIISILYRKDLRNNVVNIFIVSMQLNDIFNIGFNQFFVGLAYAHMGWSGSMFICDVVVYTSILCTGTLLWHHALIAIHRYLVVVCNQTTSYMGMSARLYVILSLIVARLIPLLVCTPALLKKMTTYSQSALRCMLAPKISGFQNLLILVVNTFLPCFIVVYCFIRIFMRVHTVSRNIKANKSQGYSTVDAKPQSPSNASQQSMRREIQISKMFAVIFIVFLFGFFPYSIIRLVDRSNSLHPDFYISLTVLFIVSISISPIIYGLMNTQINTQCKAILLTILCQKDPNLKHFRRDGPLSAFVSGVGGKKKTSVIITSKLDTKNTSVQTGEKISGRKNTIGHQPSVPIVLSNEPNTNGVGRISSENIEFVDSDGGMLDSDGGMLVFVLTYQTNKNF
jgi:hypothetical protein